MISEMCIVSYLILIYLLIVWQRPYLTQPPHRPYLRSFSTQAFSDCKLWTNNACRNSFGPRKIWLIILTQSVFHGSMASIAGSSEGNCLATEWSNADLFCYICSVLTVLRFKHRHTTLCSHGRLLVSKTEHRSYGLEVRRKDECCGG